MFYVVGIRRLVFVPCSVWSLQMAVTPRYVRRSINIWKVCLVGLLFCCTGVHGKNLLPTGCWIGFVAVALDCAWSNLLNSVAWGKYRAQTKGTTNTRVIRVCRRLLEIRGYSGDTRWVRERNPSSKLTGRRVTVNNDAFIMQKPCVVKR